MRIPISENDQYDFSLDPNEPITEFEAKVKSNTDGNVFKFKVIPDANCGKAGD